VEQVSPFGVVKLEDVGDGVEKPTRRRRRPGLYSCYREPAGVTRN
jgi:hypothetical protein